MSQLNLHTTPEFDSQLQKYMKICGFHTKAEAIRGAIRESLTYHLSHSTVTNFHNWLGQALTPAPQQAKFKNENDIWGSHDN